MYSMLPSILLQTISKVKFASLYVILIYTSGIVLWIVSYCICSFCTTEPANFYLLLFSAIATVVTVAEILKNNGLAVEKSESCL